MKKIICLLLALACSFALFACGEEEVSSEDTLIKIANESEPTKIITLSYVTEKSSEIVYKGNYVTTIDGDNFVFEYNYEEKAVVSPETVYESSIANKVGTIQYKDGKYSTDGETWSSEAPDVDVINVKLNLTKENLGEYTISKDGKVIEAVLTAENAKNLLGITIDAEIVDVVITTNGTYLTGVSISYSTELADVVVNTSYSYVPVGEGNAQ